MAAFNIFVRQSLREGRIPFDISLNQPNSETLAAMLEAERFAPCLYDILF
ncbi:MAG: type II toxin-antitoxin system RelB/DinJ family antitoxin [Lachnospiraceae bacterium]|nr:type II toxin-antitoxin system RelB/DinJ family antitoxin [Lachnospiraceae bacterium]